MEVRGSSVSSSARGPDERLELFVGHRGDGERHRERFDFRFGFGFGEPAPSAGLHAKPDNDRGRVWGWSSACPLPLVGSAEFLQFRRNSR